MATAFWTQNIDLETPAGAALKKLVAALPKHRKFEITLFGSAPLQMAVDLFRPSFDEENAADLANNTARLWPLLYGRPIDVRREIIAPALAKRRAGYGLPTRDYKRELREAVASYSTAGQAH